MCGISSQVEHRGAYQLIFAPVGLTAEEIAHDLGMFQAKYAPSDWRLFHMEGRQVERATDLVANGYCELPYFIKS
jgi:hypothetical protein